MTDQCLTPDALRLCPTCLRCVATDSDQFDDSVHRFVRLMACYELVIKLLANAAHAFVVESGPFSRYVELFEGRFVKKRPALGDWYWILEDTSKTLSRSGPPWLVPCMRWLRDVAARDTAISHLGRNVGLARQSLPTEGPNEPYSGLRCLARVVELRNAFGHGALTPRFAERYKGLLTDALEEFVLGLEFGTNWRFVVPLRYDPADPKCAIVMDPESPDTPPKSVPLGERTTKPQWNCLYVGPRAESFEDFVKLGPMMRYERTLRDYLFLNTFEDGEAEYLSYRSGDFDFQHAPTDWRGFFGISLTAPVESLQADSPTPPAPTESDAPPEAPPKPEPTPAPLTPALMPLAQPTGPSVRDLVASFSELGQHSYPSDWGRLLDEWEEALTPLKEDALAQLFGEMRKVAEEALSSDSLLQFLGNLQQRLGFHEEAVQLFEGLSKRSPDSKDKKSRYGCALFLWGSQLKADGKAKHDASMIGHAKELLGHAKKTLIESLYPHAVVRSEVWHNVRAISMLVDACCRRGEFQEAAEYCDEGLKLQSDNQRLNSQRLFIHETSGG